MKKNRYGRFALFCRHTCRIFWKHYRSDMPTPARPTLYICRHLNLHGPKTVLVFGGVCVRPLVFHPFCDFAECRRQFADYTFSVRFHMPKLMAKVLAFLASLVVVPLMKSIGAIPVYRGGDRRAVGTIRTCVRRLTEGENIVLFPDIDYTADEAHASDIYTGFFTIDRFYKQKTGEHADVVVLHIDEATRTLTASAPIPFDDSDPDMKEHAVEYVKKHLYPETPATKTDAGI